MSRLIVLGSCGGWPEPGRACSGYVLEHEGFRVVLDLGYATLPRLLSVVGPTAGELDAVVVTHRHADHAIDLHGLYRARCYGKPGAARLPLFAPSGVMDLVAGVQGDPDPIREVFDWHPLPAPPYDLGPFRLESWALPHFVPNAGVRLSSPNLTVAYTGDTGPDPALTELGRDADLYVMDASDPDQQETTPSGPNGEQLLLNARDAGTAAEAAGARRLLLTHFLPGNDRHVSRLAAAAVFSGEILLAEEGFEIQLP